MPSNVATCSDSVLEILTLAHDMLELNGVIVDEKADEPFVLGSHTTDALNCKLPFFVRPARFQTRFRRLLSRYAHITFQSWKLFLLAVMAALAPQRNSDVFRPAGSVRCPSLPTPKAAPWPR